MASSSARTFVRWTAFTSGATRYPAAPSPSAAGRFGITRTLARCALCRCTAPRGTPAAMETSTQSAGSAPRMLEATAGRSCGLTASSTRSAPMHAVSMSSVARTPYSASSARRAATGSATATSAGVARLARSKPRMNASPINPPPMMPMRTVARLLCLCVPVPVAFAIRCYACGRGPNSAVPTRTIVEPSSIATR